MAKAIRTIADASACAAKLSQGKSCTQAELKATVSILNAALKTARATARAAKREAAEAKSMMRSLLARVGL
jgi:outer membrane murein-binding lipoprotein Lpp